MNAAVKNAVKPAAGIAAAGRIRAGGKVSYAYLQRRLSAFIIDYFAGSIVISLIPMLVTSIITQETSFNTENFSAMPLMWQVLSGGIALFMAILYFIVYPMAKAHPGQTLGKRVAKIKVVCRNGEDLTYGNLVLRELLGSLVLEGQTAFSAAYLHYFLYLILPNRMVGVMVLGSVAVSVVSVVMAVFGTNHRMLHDYVGKTVVVNVEP